MNRRIPRPAGILLVLATFFPASWALGDPSSTLESPLGSARILTDDGGWSVAPTLHDRNQAAFVYDSGHDRLIVFGGYGGDYYTVSTISLNDTWTFSLVEDQWTPIAAAVTPSARSNGAAIYDPVRDRLIVFGGTSSAGLLNDLWQLSLSGAPTWTLVTPAGTPPSARSGSLAIYDPIRDRMVLFGGDDGAVNNDVFALSLGGAPSWSQLSIGNTPPPARSYGGALYDPVRDRLVIFGGKNGGGTLSDTWELAFGSSIWNPIASSGTPPQGSGPIVYDALRDRLLTYATASLWELNFAGTPTWQTVSAGPGPGNRSTHGLALDPSRDRLILFAGATLSDTWQCALSAPAWTMLDEGEPQIGTFSVVWSVCDSRGDRMIAKLRDGPNSIKTLAFDTHVWSTISPAGTPPSNRSGRSTIYDPASDQVIFFGGSTSSGLSNETWALQLSGSPQWVQLFPTGTPPVPRSGHTAILDTLGDRMIVAGGTSEAGVMNDVWALSLTGTLGWSQLFPTGTPPAQIYSPSVYDETGNRMIIMNAAAVSILSLGNSPAWSTAPGNGTSFKPFYDGPRDRVIGFESADNYGPPRYWAFDLDSLTWTQLYPVGGTPWGLKYSHAFALVFDPNRHRLLQFGVVKCSGAGLCITWNDTWQWSFAPPEPAVSVEPIGWNLAHSALLSVAPSPARGAQRFAFRIASGDAPQAIEIYSVEGRRIWHESLQARGPGVQALSWNGRTADGKRAPAAVYFARLVTARVSSTRRFVRL